jgi:PKD repeat protein
MKSYSKIVIVCLLLFCAIGFVSADPYIEPYTISLQHFNGSQGQTKLSDENATINWGGGYPTRTFINTSTFKFGSSSLYLGDGGTNNPVNQTNMAMKLPTAEHTVEFWVYLPTSGSVAQQIVAKDLGAAPFYQLYMGADNIVQMYYNASATGSSGNWLPRGMWNSVAIVKNNTQFRLYVNGSLMTSAAVITPTSLSTTTPFWIGSGNARTQPVLPGTFFDEFRVSNTARYSGASYTPQTSEFPYWIITTDTITSSFTMMNLTENSSFSSGTITGDAPFLVQFTNTSTGNNQSSWVWNYTPLSTGIPVTFNQTSFGTTQYNFTTPDSYFIKLNASGITGQNISTQTAWVNVTAPRQAFANFTANVTTAYIPTAYVQFTDTSLYKHDVWLWDFGDGATSTSQNPIHQYTALGSYNVSLTVSRSDNVTNTDTTTKNSYIAVDYNPFYVHADFSGNPVSGSPGLLVSFSDLKTVGNTSFPLVCNWSFGDSLSITPYSSTCGDVQHVYTYAGVYSVNYSISSYGNTSYEHKTDYIAVSTIQNAQNTNVVWNARDVAIQLLDANYNPIIGAPVSMNASNSSLPGGMSGAVAYFKNTYGVPESVAISMLAANTTYFGITDDYGFVAVQVTSVIQYQVNTVDSNGIPVTRLFWPAGPYYQIVTANSTVAGIAARGRAQNSINKYSTFNTTFWEPNTTHSCMGINVYDSTGGTTNVFSWWTLVDNSTTWWINSTAIGGYGPINSTKCVLHIPYQRWKWGGITG